MRHQVEPVEPATLGRLVTSWQGVTRRRRGLDALLDTIETLQGAPLAASLLEREILPARIEGYEPGDLDTLLAAGEVVWCGVEPLGDRDGRVALYLTDALPRLWRPPDGAPVVVATLVRAVPTARGPPPRPAAAAPARAARRARAGDPRAPARVGRVVLRRRSTRPSAAAFRATRSTRCGRWSGAACVTNDSLAGAARLRRRAR